MNKPNVILMMADDMGWGDVGFNGNEIIQTPNLDRLAHAGIRFQSFFSGAPVCSPTRASCLTGRHPFRHGIWSANVGHLPRQEVNLSLVLRGEGYATGIFGKWHMGIPNPDYRGKAGGEKHYCFPEWFDFDEHFVTHHAVPTWDPFGADGTEAATTGNPYFENGKRVTEPLVGCDSRITMDRAIPFIRKSVADNKPFFAAIWFHAPHGPVVAGPEYRAMYSQYGEKEQHFYGCITALDDQVGRLSAELRALGVDQNTMLWFCSDNGPAGQQGVGSTGGLRGRKGSLFSGGVGVPGFLHWPEQVKAGRMVDMPCSTLDYLPTIFDAVGAQMPDDRPLDGISLLPMICENVEARPKAIPFRFHMPKHRLFDAPTISLIKGQHKFLSNFSEDGEEDLLFDLRADRGETRSILDAQPDLAGEMKEEARTFVESASLSYGGADYHEADYKPAGRWIPVTGDWPEQAPEE